MQTAIIEANAAQYVVQNDMVETAQSVTVPVLYSSIDMPPAINTDEVAQSSTVVQHDTTVAQATANLRKYFEHLCAEREAWESNAYRTSNDQLYALLQKCYQTYKAMGFDNAEANALRAGMQDYIKSKGYVFSSATHTIVKIVKCVFGADRRRVSAYGIVLRAALADKVAVDAIPEYIRQAGGIEEIRLAKSPNAMSTKQKAAVAVDAVKADSLGVFTSSSLSERFDAGKTGAPVVLIGHWQPDGSVIMRSVVQSDTVITAALASYYSSNKDAVQKQAQQQQAANDEQIKQDAVAAAAQSAIVNA